MKGYLATGSGTVPREWIDSNGHVNIAHYMALFDRGSETLLERLRRRLGPAPGDFAVVASRIYVEHKNELFEGEPWRLWTGLITLERSFLTLTHRLMSGESLRAKCDIRSVYFSRSTRTSITLDKSALAAAGEFVIAGLSDRFLPDR